MILSAASSSASRPALQPIAVLVVDDQRAVREGVARLIAGAPLALRTIAVAATGAEALRLAVKVQPEIVVLDADLAGEDGLSLIPQFGGGAAVLVLSCHADAATRERAVRLGAQAFLEKHRPAAELLGAIARFATLQVRGEEMPGPQGESAYPSPVASSDVHEAGRS
jgi:two-component system nitrate/nitrite response regulator NarL